MASSIFIPDIVDETDAGIFATNPVRATLPVVVAGTQETRAAAHNTIRQELVVVGCANLKETNFAFDSSVVAPRARDGFASLAKLLQRHVDCPMTIFGHSDPKGGFRYNHFLSERRARAIFAVLVRDVTIWEKLFSDREEAIGDVWGPKALQLMLTALGSSAPVMNTLAARTVLFAAYMEFLRGEPGANPTFPGLTPNDFLGRGDQRATLQGCSKFNPQLLFSKTEQTDFDKKKELEESRNAANEPNRRVVIYLFKKGTVIDRALWPCPKATEGEARCIARQWSNGEDRRSRLFEDHRRRFGREVRPDRRTLVPPNPKVAGEIGLEETTFGCRFYHGIALHSPCERDLKLWGVQLFVDAPTALTPGGNTKSADKVELKDRRFVAIVGESPDAPSIRGRTNDKGIVALPLFDPLVTIRLKIDAFDALVPPQPPPATPPAPGNTPPTADSDAFADEDQFVELRLAAGTLKPIRRRDEDSPQFDPDFDEEIPAPTADERELAAMQRLYNLGFGSDDTGGERFGNWTVDLRRQFLLQFQRDNALTQSGVVDPETADALFAAHGS